MSKSAVLKRNLLFFDGLKIIFLFRTSSYLSYLNATERRWQSGHLKLNRRHLTCSGLKWSEGAGLGREWKITQREAGGAGGFSLRMVLYVSAAAAKSSDITGASADTTHGRWVLTSRPLSK